MAALTLANDLAADLPIICSIQKAANQTVRLISEPASQMLSFSCNSINFFIKQRRKKTHGVRLFCAWCELPPVYFPAAKR
jgi:hypothetical protein